MDGVIKIRCVIDSIDRRNFLVDFCIHFFSFKTKKMYSKYVFVASVVSSFFRWLWIEINERGT